MSAPRGERVLIVIRQFFPLAAGAETQALRQAQSYIEMGCPARVVTARHDPALPEEDVVEGVPVTRLQTSARRFLGSIVYLANLAMYLVRHAREYDAVLAFHLKQSAAVAALVSALLRKRVVISDQAAGEFGDIEALRNARFGRVLLWACRQAEAFVSGSSDITDELTAAGVAKERIRFIPNGIPIERFSRVCDRDGARERVRVPAGAFVAVNVGRHTAQKDLRTLLAGWREFARKHPQALLILVGDGDERAMLEGLTRDWGLGESVRFEGWRTNVADYLAAADIFVASSVSEGTHIALGEAMAAGLPVVATPVGGAPDFVRDRENGRLFPVGGVAELAAALGRLESDAEARAVMGRRAAETAAAVLEQGSTARRHLDALFGPPAQRRSGQRRICVTHLIATLDRGGSEQQMAALAVGLDAMRFDVRVLCLTRGGPVAETLERAGVPYRVFAKAGKADFRALFRLAVECFLRPPTILHTWLFTSNAYGRAAALLAGVPHVVASERSTDPWKRRAHRAIDRLLAQASDFIVANSRCVADSLVENGIPARRVAVIPNSVDAARFRPRDAAEARAALALPADGRLVGYVGRLAFEKRPLLFVEAARRFLTSVPDARAVLFGTGPLEVEVKAAAASLADRIMLYGDCDRVELAHAAIDCLVLTSEWEGFPNAVLEAMASARPVVAVELPATRELVLDGVTGRLTGDSPEEIAAAVARILADPEAARRMGEAGRARVEERYSIERTVAAYERLYCRMVQCPAGREAL